MPFSGLGFILSATFRLLSDSPHCGQRTTSEQQIETNPKNPSQIAHSFMPCHERNTANPIPTSAQICASFSTWSGAINLYIIYLYQRVARSAKGCLGPRGADTTDFATGWRAPFAPSVMLRALSPAIAVSGHCIYRTNL